MATNVARTGRTDSRVAAVRAPTETRPFFMTSEFMVLVVMTVALFIASAVVDDVDSQLAWILGSAMVGAYILSRGIAKAATRSSSYDPREDLIDRDSADSPRVRVRD